MALEEPEVSSENRGPGFVAIRREVIFTQDEPLLVCLCECQDAYNTCILTPATNITPEFKDGVALNE